MNKILPLVFMAVALIASGCTSTSTPSGNVKEFVVNYSMTFENGAPHAVLSPGEIDVNSGDDVRIIVEMKNTGARNFSNATNFTGNNTGRFNMTGGNVTRNISRGQGFNRTPGGQRSSIIFNIDEFNVHEQLQAGQPTAVEFTADRSGEFRYYISVNNNSEGTATGTLKVLG